MSINSTACLFVLSFLSNNAFCREPENVLPMRLERGNLKEYMGESADPNFWPVRGRRDDKNDDSANPSAIVYLGGDLSYRRGGRKSSDEETTTGVFWAGRGRSSDAGDPEDGNFWAHRGRSFEPWSDNSFPGSRIATEEPGWIWLGKGQTQSVQASKTSVDDRNFCSHLGRSKRDTFRQKLCHLKRKANNLIRELPQSEQFWPVRGKRPTKASPRMPEEEQFWPMKGKRDEFWQENLRDLKTFWPVRGRREGEDTKNKDKQTTSDKVT